MFEVYVVDVDSHRVKDRSGLKTQSKIFNERRLLTLLTENTTLFIQIISGCKHLSNIKVQNNQKKIYRGFWETFRGLKTNTNSKGNYMFCYKLTQVSMTLQLSRRTVF